jgi:DNA-binding HxlR family transcriptional regulator
VTSRSYRELCPIARTSDLLGERWTVLIIRELLLGPKRFSDFRERLPSMGTNRLSERLTTLCDAGVVERLGRTEGYALTPWGEGLRPILFDIVRWGFPLLLQREEGDASRAEIIALGLTALLPPAADATGVRETYAFSIDDERFHVSFQEGRYRAASGLPDAPADGTVTGSIAAFLDTVMGGEGGAEQLQIVADPAARDRILALLGAPAALAAAHA